MKKQDLIKMYANLFETTHVEAEQVLGNIGTLLEECVAMGETISFPGVLTIGVKKRAPRKGYNFATGETTILESKTVPYVKVGSKLKTAAVNAPIEE